MARPQKYTDEQYQDWIRAQASAGRSVHDITAGELQAAIGGQYSRCQTILTAVADELEAQRVDEKQAAIPGWFKAFIADVTDQVHAAAESQWLNVGRSITAQIEEAREAFNAKREELEQQAASHLAEIQRLEAGLEASEQACDEYKALNARLEKQADDATATVREQRERLADKDEQIQSLSEQVMAVRQDKDALASDLYGLRAKHEDLIEAKREVDARNRQLQGELTEARSEADQRTRQMDSVIRERDAAFNERDDQKQRVTSLSDQLSALTQERDRLSLQHEHQADRAASLGQKLEKVEAAADQLKSELAASRQQAAVCEQKTEGLVQQLAAAEQRYAALLERLAPPADETTGKGDR